MELHQPRGPLHLATAEKRELEKAEGYAAGNRVVWDHMIAQRLCKRGLLAANEANYALTDDGRAALAAPGEI